MMIPPSPRKPRERLLLRFEKLLGNNEFNHLTIILTFYFFADT